ncbi:MAG TPA: type II toxin-antitoxin system VapC family toxin [Bryobacteraceae bacterium]
MIVVHVTEAQLAEDVRGVLEKVEAGADVVVERGDRAVTIVELVHGIQRAKLESQHERRRIFVQDLRAAIRVYAVTEEIAERAGIISGQQGEKGLATPLADLLIGATALHLNFGVLTENTRHFQTIPSLTVRHL